MYLQGLGHDTLYPAFDVINENLGGPSALQAIVASLSVSFLVRMCLIPSFRNLRASLMQSSTGSNLSSMSYHVNADEAYSMYNGAPNVEFDVRICRVQASASLETWRQL